MDIQQTIKDRYKSLPADIKEAIKSNDLAGKFNLIAEKHSLHVDQNGALQTETLLVMLGLESTHDYLGNIQKELDISRDEALSIAIDINSQILDPIKDSLRIMQEGEGIDEPVYQSKPVTPANLPTPTPAQPVPSFVGLEKAGQFTIEKPTQASSSPQYKEENINKEALLKSIEDKPAPATAAVAPMIDHLLTAHVNSSEKIEVKEVPVAPVVEKKPEENKVVEQKKPYSVDPYREQF